jgi:hypothetical protein
MYRAGIESILGFRVQGTSFTLAPCIPAAWPFSVEHGRDLPGVDRAEDLPVAPEQPLAALEPGIVVWKCLFGAGGHRVRDT